MKYNKPQLNIRMIDIQNVEWNEFKLAKYGRTVKLMYKKEPVQFCTSALYTPFGVKGIDKEWANFTEYSIDCVLNQASSETAIAFKSFLEKLDQVLNQLFKDNLYIFNNDMNGNETYTPILRENGSYPKLLKVQLPRDKNGNFETVMFDEKKDKIKVIEGSIVELLPKGKTFKCIIECSKVWFYNGKVGSIWNAVQLKFSDPKVQKQVSNIYNTIMIED